MAQENKIQLLKSTVAGRRPPTDIDNIGVPFINFTDKALGVMNASGVATDLLAVRYYSDKGKYAIGDLVTRNAKVYRALVAVSPKVWADADWEDITLISNIPRAFTGEVHFDTLDGLYTDYEQTGILKVTLGANPIEGSRQRIQITVNDPNQISWGFEFVGHLVLQKNHIAQLQLHYVHGKVWVTVIASTPNSPFVTKWKTGSSKSIQLPLKDHYNYAFTVDWGDNTTNFITHWDQLETLHKYAGPGTYTVTITGVCERFAFERAGDKDKLIDIMSWGNTGFLNCKDMFRECSKLINISAVDSGDFSKCVSLKHIFGECINLVSIKTNNWNLQSTITMSGMFMNNVKFTTWTGANTIKNTYNVEDMSTMLDGCIAFTVFDARDWDTSKIKTTAGLFRGCTALTIIRMTNWPFWSLEDARFMCKNCVKTVTFDFGINQLFENLLYANSMFEGCIAARGITVTNWTMTRMVSAEKMFFGCHARLRVIGLDTWQPRMCRNFRNFLPSTRLTPDQYSLLLLKWSGIVLSPYVIADFNLCKFNNHAAHNKMTTIPIAWQITDAGVV